MKKNMGSADKIIRYALAGIFIALYLMEVATGALGIAFLVLSAVFVVTSFVSFCPLYALFGANTCKTDAG